MSSKIIGRPCKNCGGTERYPGSYSCVACTNRRSAINKATSAYKAKANVYWMVKRYGMTPDDMAAMLNAQGGACALCGTFDPGNKRGWVVDHDHQTGAVRGVVCHGCNVGLGGFSDDTTKLLKAVEYLDRHAAESAGRDDLPLFSLGETQ